MRIFSLIKVILKPCSKISLWISIFLKTFKINQIIPVRRIIFITKMSEMMVRKWYQKNPTFFVLSFILSSLIACAPKPQKSVVPDQVTPPFLHYKGEGPIPKGLWFTGVNFVNGGYLGRLDLQNGEIKRQLLRIGPDTIVTPDSMESLFVLSRGGQESMAKVKNAEGEIQESRSLPILSNPQAAITDRNGNIWVSFLELNEVHVYSNDLKELMAQVDLSALALKNTPNSSHAGPSESEHADLGPMALFKDGTLLVAAQRLHREHAWAPDSKAGLAFINTKTHEVESTHFIDAVNPTYVGVNSLSSRILVVGKGDLSASTGVMGQFFFFNPADLATAPLQMVAGKIIAADWAQGADFPALIVWYPLENKSCIQLGTVKLTCDGNSENGGYVFSAIRNIGNIIFVSFYGNQTSELWVITKNQDEGDVKVQKIPMELPIFSLSFGP